MKGKKKMKLKKLLISALALSMLVSCTAKDNNDDGNTNNSSNGANDSETTAPENDNTNGGQTDTDDTNGTNDTNGTADDNAGVNEDTGSSSVDKVESADDAVAFIEANIYSQCEDILPMMIETTVLSGDNMDSITFNTGLTDTSGITDIIISEPAVSSIAFSLIYLRTDGTNTEELQQSLGNSVNPSKWVCVTAEAVSSITLDNDILLVMADRDQVDTILDCAEKAADGVFENIGSRVDFTK